MSCVQFGGPAAGRVLLPSTLTAAGRLRFPAVAEFLPQVALAPTRRKVLMVGLLPTQPEASAAAHLNQERYGMLR